MNTVVEYAAKLNHIFQQEEIQTEEKLKKSLEILRSIKEFGERKDLPTVFCCFVNLYLIHGLHLSFPENAKKNIQEDERPFFSVTRNDEQFFHYIDNEAELAENSDYFLLQVQKLTDCQEEFVDFKNLYLGIFHQKKEYFLNLLEKELPVVDYYLCYMAIRDHIFDIEQRKNGTKSKEEFLASKEELCIRYSRFKQRKFSFLQAESNDGSVTTNTSQSTNIPIFPLPTIRYSDSFCEEILLCQKEIWKIYNSRTMQQRMLVYETIENKLCEITETQQMGIITEKGQRKQHDLFSNIPEIRMEYLMFPLKMDFDRNTFSLLMQNYLDYQELEEVKDALEKNNQELEEKNRLLEKNKAEKIEIINEHKHNWKHLTLPSIVSSISKELKSLGNLTQANLLQKLYVDFISHQGDLKLLALKYEAVDNTALAIEFTRFIGRINEEKDCSAKSLSHILGESLELTLFRLLHHVSEDEAEVLLHSERSQVNLRDKFTDYLNKRKNITEIFHWFSDHIYPFKVNSLHTCWDQYGFIEYEVSYFYIEQIFLDLIVNALNYGLKEDNGWIEVNFDFKDPYAIFTVRNPVQTETSFLKGSGQGLTSVKNAIARLNNTENVEEFTKITVENKVHTVEMKITKNIFPK